MSLNQEIEKATHVDWCNNNKLFVHSENAIRQTEYLCNLNVKPPKNIKLLEEDEVGEEFHHVPGCLNEIDIHTNITKVNGGINYSNECLEEHWKEKQKKASEPNKEEETDEKHTSRSSTASPSTSCSSSSGTSTRKQNSKGGRGKSKGKNKKKPFKQGDTSDDYNSDTVREVLEKCKLSKNAAIKGLIKNHKIKLEDLKIPSDKYRMRLVEHPEVPGVFVQPVQAYGDINEDEYKEIDFTVPRIGKKKVVTPHDYYTQELDDSFFNFVRKDNAEN